MKTVQIISGVILVGVLAGCARTPAVGGGEAARTEKPLPVFTLAEHFGVSHPDQIVTFDLARAIDPQAVVLLGPDGEPVSWQLLDAGARLAVRTDLPANASKSWTLTRKTPEGREPPPEISPVVVVETDAWFEMVNGLTGVRVPKPPASLSPTPAPVRAVRLRDGRWCPGEPAPALDNVARAMVVRVVERGPLVAVVEVDYALERTPLRDERRGVQVAEAGEGFYRCRIELQAGQPSILFEEEADVDTSWSLDLQAGLAADQARYRGHHAKEPRHGRLADGGEYVASHARPAADALFDLPFDRSYGSNYYTSLGQWPAIRRLAVWDPWCFDSGWYWMLYKREGGDDANLVGIFAGRASRALGAANSGVGVFTRGGEGVERGAGFTMAINRRSPDARAWGRVRFQWGLFVGTQADLLPPNNIQPINRQMNLHGGFNLDKIARYTLDLPEPADGFGALYMPREARDRMIEKLRADGSGPHGRGFHTYLYNADPTIRPLIDMWVDETGEKTREQARHVVREAGRILDAFVNDGGIYNTGVHYWHGGLAMSRLTVWIDQVLAGEALDDDLRAQVKAAAALFGYLLWDDDFVPLHGGHGLNLGTANMPVQQTGYRHQYALLLARHPDFREPAAGVAEAALRDVRATINEHGAHMGSSHYLGASMGPLLNTLVQLKRADIYNAFADEPRLRRFAEFYMQFVTPHEPRYDNLRIRIPTGNAEANNPQFLAGVLGTAFADVDPELSARLMGSWAQSGKPHTGFHVSTLLMTDEELPQADPALGGATFPGYFSVLRCGWGEPHEAAAWLVGDRWYRDHRNHGEHGMVSLYAHAAPLALNWGPMYSPYAPSALLRNTLLPADSDWKAVPAPHEGGPGDWSTSALDAFVPAADGGMAQCAASGFGSTWTRRVHLRQAGQGRPVFLIDDRFATVPLVFSLAMACEDVVRTPQGERKPGEGFILPAGVSRLDFTGQPLDKHPDGGIDWCLFVAAATPQEAFLSEWAHRNRRGQRQVILRLLGKDNFRVAIVPWPKGRSPQSIAVHRHEDGLAVEVDGQTVRFE